MDIPEGLSVAEAELLLNGVDVQIQKVEGMQCGEQPFGGYHVRQNFVLIDGELYRVTKRVLIHEDQFGN